jgi:phosphatidylglycerophosphate synthase
MALDLRVDRSELLTLPNLISLSRLPLLGAIVLLLDSPLRYPLFALFVLSDAVDGYVARRLDQTSELGALLDPALDKLTAFVLFFVLFPRTGLPWEYLVLFFARDAFVVSLGGLLPFIDVPDTGMVKARLFGKAVTNLQFFAMVAMLVPHVFATEALLWLLGVASVLAIGDYIVFTGRAVTEDGAFHDRWSVAAAYVGVIAVFGVVVALLLREEMVQFVGSLPV